MNENKPQKPHEILTKQRDDYLHGMLFTIYESNQIEDKSYYELFAYSDMTIPPKVSVDLLFYRKEERDFFRKFEDIKVPWEDEYCEREFYPMHYLSYLILDKLSTLYKPRKQKEVDYDGFDYICETYNESSFKRLKEKYNESVHQIIGEIEHDGLTIQDILSHKGNTI